METWYKEELQDNGHIRVNLMPIVRTLDPADIARTSEVPPHWKDREVLLKGKGPVWAYARLTYLAVAAGAASIRVYQPAEKDTYPEGLPVYPRPTVGNSVPTWHHMQTGPGGKSLHALLKDDPTGQSHWDMATLLQQSSPEIPPGTDTLIISGKGSNWMYAVLAAQAATRQIPELRCDCPTLAGFLSIGLLNPGQVQPKTTADGTGAGIVLAIVGDPNTGKSVFSKTLSVLLRQIWPDAWLYDADQASPTSDWFLRMMNAGHAPEAKALREHQKRKWDHAMERKAAADLSALPKSLRLVVADMPGGIHPKTPEDLTRPQRIPPGREVMMHPVDGFLILGREENPGTFVEWRRELAKHGLESRIWGEIRSINHQTPLSVDFELENNLITGTASGLDRENLSTLSDRSTEKLRALAPLLSKIRSQMIRKAIDMDAQMLVEKARAACAMAFLTKEGGVSYGAAVLTQDGKIFQSGQYSSFNHSTNIHAECGVMLQAAMAGHPDIKLLALASTAPQGIARPCGVCRQVMLEHAQRTGYDFHVAMCSASGEIDILRVSELLPCAWSSHQAGQLDSLAVQKGRTGLRNGRSWSGTAQTGDHVIFGGNRYLGMVWEPRLDASGRLWVKVKYHRQGGQWIKWPHSLTEGHAYARCLLEHGLCSSDTPCGPIAILRPDHVEKIIPMSPPHDTGIPDGLLHLLKAAGITIDQIQISGSRSVGLTETGSDWDLIVQARPQQIASYRKLAHLALAEEKASLPAESGTWKLLDRIFPGGKDAVIQEQRFLETLRFGDQSAALIFVPHEEAFLAALLPDGAPPPIRTSASGLVRQAETAAWKSSRFELETLDGIQEVRSYLKPANLVKNGDRICLTGWRVQLPDGGTRIVMASAATDRIRWLSTEKNA